MYNNKEPILSDEDIKAWSLLMKTAEAHSKTIQHTRHIDNAKKTVESAIKSCSTSCVMWSGGKDSTVMTHLICCEMGISVPVASEKDDLDYPGELEYIEELSSKWGIDLRILTPSCSLKQWIKNNSSFQPDEDVHSRSSELSKNFFYGLVEEFGSSFDLIFLGLRAEESKGRRLNRAVRGTVYKKKPSKWSNAGQWVATPLADWKGIDVYAYAASRGFELFSIYKCIALMHQDEPWHLRKSWWIPGQSARIGSVVWLKRYWPSLYKQLISLAPNLR